MPIANRDTMYYTDLLNFGLTRTAGSDIVTDIKSFEKETNSTNIILKKEYARQVQVGPYYCADRGVFNWSSGDTILEHNDVRSTLLAGSDLKGGVQYARVLGGGNKIIFTYSPIPHENGPWIENREVNLEVDPAALIRVPAISYVNAQWGAFKDSVLVIGNRRFSPEYCQTIVPIFLYSFDGEKCSFFHEINVDKMSTFLQYIWWSALSATTFFNDKGDYQFYLNLTTNVTPSKPSQGKYNCQGYTSDYMLFNVISDNGCTSLKLNQSKQIVHTAQDAGQNNVYPKIMIIANSYTEPDEGKYHAGTINASFVENQFKPSGISAVEVANIIKKENKTGGIDNIGDAAGVSINGMILSVPPIIIDPESPNEMTGQQGYVKMTNAFSEGVKDTKTLSHITNKSLGIELGGMLPGIPISIGGSLSSTVENTKESKETEEKIIVYQGESILDKATGGMLIGTRQSAKGLILNTIKAHQSEVVGYTNGPKVKLESIVPDVPHFKPSWISRIFNVLTPGKIINSEAIDPLSKGITPYKPLSSGEGSDTYKDILHSLYRLEKDQMISLMAESHLEIVSSGTNETKMTLTTASIQEESKTKTTSYSFDTEVAIPEILPIKASGETTTESTLCTRNSDAKSSGWEIAYKRGVTNDQYNCRVTPVLYKISVPKLKIRYGCYKDKILTEHRINLGFISDYMWRNNAVFWLLSYKKWINIATGKPVVPEP